MRGSRFIAALLGLVLLVGTIVGVSASQPQTPVSHATWVTTDGGCLTENETRLLAKINRLRADQALPPLRADLNLTMAAQHHAQSMSNNRYFSHDLLPEGKTWWESAVEDYFVSATATHGENIAWGNASAADTYNQWLGSAAHRDNMINPAYRAIGLAEFIGPAPDPKITGNTSTWVTGFSSSFVEEMPKCGVATPTAVPTTAPLTPTPRPTGTLVPPTTPVPTAVPTLVPTVTLPPTEFPPRSGTWDFTISAPRLPVGTYVIKPGEAIEMYDSTSGQLFTVAVDPLTGETTLTIADEPNQG